MQKASLYRHFDAEGQLLYVGVSCNIGARTDIHRGGGSHWYFDVVRIDVEHFPNRLRAEYAEAIAIRDEKPRWNKKQPPIPDLKYIEEWEEDGLAMGLPCR